MTKSRVMRWVRHVARMGELVNINRVLVRKCVRKKTHGRPSWRWETILKLILKNIISDIKRILKKFMDWINVAQDREKWTGCCEHDNEIPRSIKCEGFLDYLRNYQLIS
jgi:hypothetical protein